MSDMDHANIDTFFLRKSRIDYCISSDRYPAIRAVRLGSVSSMGSSRTSSFLGKNLEIGGETELTGREERWSLTVAINRSRAAF